MENLEAVISSATEEGDVMKKIDAAHGQYKDNVTDNTNVESKLPFSSLPQGTDPNPFTIGPLGSK